jgi:hypothetical protein
MVADKGDGVCQVGACVAKTASRLETKGNGIEQRVMGQHSV